MKKTSKYKTNAKQMQYKTNAKQNQQQNPNQSKNNKPT